MPPYICVPHVPIYWSERINKIEVEVDGPESLSTKHFLESYSSAARFQFVLLKQV